MALWDTAGYEGYDRLRPLVYPGTDVFILCFSLISPASFENIRAKWHPEITHHCPGKPYVLVGTKKDLTHDLKTQDCLAKSGTHIITHESGQKLAREIKAFAYLECSAIPEERVQEVFSTAIRASRMVRRRTHTQKCTI